MTKTLLVLAASCAVLLALAACSGGDTLHVGRDATPQAGSGGSSPGTNAGSGAVTSGDASVGRFDNALGVEVHDLADMKIEIVTLACAGDCADIAAIAHGGNPPYAFAWEDGSTDPRRHVCLDADAALDVTAHDSAIADPEFHHALQTAHARVTAQVLDCSDGGVPPGDGGTLCVENGSFETPTAFTGAFDAPPWNACVNQNPDIPGWPSTPDLDDATSGDLSPSDGKTYLHLGWASPLHEIVTQKLCQRMLARHSYAFTIDLASTTGSAAELAVYGSMNDCSRSELLYRSQPLDSGAWQNTCITLTPQQDALYLTLEPTGATPDMAFLLTDHLVPVDRCP